MPDLSPEQNAELLASMDKGIEAAESFAGASADEMNFSTVLPANQPSNDVVPDDVPQPPADHPDAPKGPANVDDEDDEVPGDDLPPSDPQQPKPPAKAKPTEPAAPAQDPDAPPVDPDTPPADTPPADPTEDDKLAAALKGRTKQRFEELTGEVKEFAPIREAMAKLEIKGVDDLQALSTRAKYGEDMVDMVMATGATAEVYKGALDYLTVQNEAISTGDPAKAKAALDMLAPAVRNLAALAGIDPTTLIGDPLDADPRLKQLVDDGDMTREEALQRVSQATRGTIAEQGRKASEQNAAAEQARAEGVAWLRQFDAAQLAADPVGYGARRMALHEQVKEIRATRPASEWPAATAAAYERLKLIPVAPAAAPPPPRQDPPRNGPAAARQTPRMGPVRSGGHKPPMRQQFDDPLKALDAGLDAAFGNYDD